MRVAFYKFKGRTFLCPESPLKENDIVCSLLPLQKVDPRDLFQYVSDGNETHTVRKDRLDLIQSGAFDWERKQFMTHNQEVESQIKSMNTYFHSVRHKLI